nr:protein DpdE [Jatrophihabitans telluris]
MQRDGPPTPSELSVGCVVTFTGAPGIGRVGDLSDGRVRVDFFESAAEPVVGSRWLPLPDVRRVLLGEQTRVFFVDGGGRWRAGRVVGGGPGGYFVRLPNSSMDTDIPEDQIFVRWEKVPRDPLQVLLAGANETPRYRDVRQPVRRLLLAERSATGSATGITSSSVRIHPHQISAALRIIHDPVQRYLLADEVGMGKTIQAGMVMRQLLIDGAGRREIGVIVPDALVPQWKAELHTKFHLDDFPTADGSSPVRIVGHGDVGGWAALVNVDLLVIDEAHLLARTASPSASPYRELAAVAHRAPRILMLSATPFSRGVTTHLALLHLLDPQMFRWEDRDSFERLLESRHELAAAVFGLDEEPDADNPELLEIQFDQIRRQIPADEAVQAVMQRAMKVYGPAGTDPKHVDLEQLRRAVAAVRTHVSETYRLHHRVIRNRRHVVAMQTLDDEGLLTPFEFTGRLRPKVIRLEALEASAGAAAIATWVNRCAEAILDNEMDPVPFGPVLAVLLSRVGGPVTDLCNVLDFRINGRETPGSFSAIESEALVAAPVLEFETDLLDILRAQMPIDGLEALATAIAQRCQAPAKAIAFCGRGELAGDLVARIPVNQGVVNHVHAHVRSQTETEREQATAAWLKSGGVLVVDDSGEIGRNFQDADLAFHVRLPSNPNLLEQRIGRLDRYGHQRATTQFVVADDDHTGIPASWLKVLVRGFEIFSGSISAFHEAVEDLVGELWTVLLTEGLDEFVERAEPIREALKREKRRVNELDALESSYGSQIDGEAVASAIARYEEDSAGIEAAYRSLIEGNEGFRFVGRTNRDGSTTFERDYQNKPLLSERLLSRLLRVEGSRTGVFDRWTAGDRRLFRRGNPFMDGIELLLNLDDRGQAVAMWRLNPRWPLEPLPVFGFDFVVEAALDPIVSAMVGLGEVEPVARRRADTAFPPQYQQVWIPSDTSSPVLDPTFAEYLSQPLRKDKGDVNLNPDRIAALHTLLGGEANLAAVAEGCFSVARHHVEHISDVVEASRRAAEKVNGDADMLIAQSRARSRAAGFVMDSALLEAEIATSRAIATAVSSPVLRLSSVSCVVVSAQSWTDYV